MFKIIDSSPGSLPATLPASNIFIDRVKNSLPLVCTEMEALRKQDDGKLFGKTLSYEYKRDDSARNFGWRDIATLGIPFADSYLVNSVQQMRHCNDKLDSNLSIKVERSQGEYIGRNYDSINMTILVVNNFVPAKARLFREDLPGFAEVHSRCIPSITEERACEILQHIQSLNGSFTVQSLFHELDSFEADLRKPSKERVGERMEEIAAFKLG